MKWAFSVRKRMRQKKDTQIKKDIDNTTILLARTQERMDMLRFTEIQLVQNTKEISSLMKLYIT